MHTRRWLPALAFALIQSTLAAAQTPPANQNPAPASPPAQTAGRGGPVKSPEVGADRRVTFRLRAPNATAVLVALSGRRLPMQKDEQGVWTVATDPLEPNIYTYSFNVDGATINDPANRER